MLIKLSRAFVHLVCWPTLGRTKDAVIGNLACAFRPARSVSNIATLHVRLAPHQPKMQ